MKLDIRGKSYHVDIHQHLSNIPILVLLHGFMGSGKAFSHLINDLKEFCNPVTVDLLGHGKTEGDADFKRFNIDEQVKDLTHIISYFNSHDVVLHGYSMGGRLALQYTLAYPNSINGLILESTTYGITDNRKRRKRQVVDKDRAQAIETDFEQFLSSWDRLPIFDNGIKVPVSLQEHYRSIQAGQQPLHMANSLRGFGTGSMPPIRQKLDKLSMPVLILAGEADSKYCKLAHEMEQKISDSKAAIVRNAGHRIHLENPEGFLSEIKSFLMPYRKT